MSYKGPFNLNADFESGTHTPTLTNVANVSSSTAFPCHYMRVGNVVTVSGRVRFTPSAVDTNTAFRMSIPVESNFGGMGNAGGTFSSYTTTNTNAGGVYADSATNTVLFATRSSSTALVDYAFTFTYQVI